VIYARLQHRYQHAQPDQQVRWQEFGEHSHQKRHQREVRDEQGREKSHQREDLRSPLARRPMQRRAR